MAINLMRLLAVIALVNLLTSGAGYCEGGTGDFPKLDTVYFQQALLRDVAEYLGAQSKYRIRLTGDVNQILDLWVNYRGDGETLDRVLDGVLAFVKQEHGLDLVWRVVGKDEVLIEKRPVKV